MSGSAGCVDPYADDVPPTALYILMVIGYPAIAVALYAFVHALLQRPDAFTAADKMSKPVWLGITGGAVVVLLFFRTPDTMFWIVGLVAVLVYIVDVRPRVVEVQKGRP